MNLSRSSCSLALETNLVNRTLPRKLFKARWPSGLRRQTKVYLSGVVHLIRKGVGSNPTLVTFGLLAPECRAVWIRFASPASHACLFCRTNGLQIRAP